jgi:hypothetical protein
MRPVRIGKWSVNPKPFVFTQKFGGGMHQVEAGGRHFLVTRVHKIQSVRVNSSGRGKRTSQPIGKGVYGDEELGIQQKKIFSRCPRKSLCARKFFEA